MTTAAPAIMPMPMSAECQAIYRTLCDCVDEKDYYSAQQKCLTARTRLLRKNCTDDAHALLFAMCRRLCDVSEFGGASDLAKALFKSLEDRKIAPTSALLSSVFELLDLFATKEKEFGELALHAVSWTAKAGNVPTGNPSLHHHIGLIYSELGMLNETSRHLLVGTVESAEALAVFILQASRRSNLALENIPLNIVHPLLVYIRAGRIAHAHRLLATTGKLLTQIHAGFQLERIPTAATDSNSFSLYNSAILNFSNLLILLCQRGEHAATGFTALKKQFSGALSVFAPETRELLDNIGEKYFGIRVHRDMGANPLQNIMSLLGGF